MTVRSFVYAREVVDLLCMLWQETIQHPPSTKQPQRTPHGRQRQWSGRFAAVFNAKRRQVITYSTLAHACTIWIRCKAHVINNLRISIFMSTRGTFRGARKVGDSIDTIRADWPLNVCRYQCIRWLSTWEYWLKAGPLSPTHSHIAHHAKSFFHNTTHRVKCVCLNKPIPLCTTCMIYWHSATGKGLWT